MRSPRDLDAALECPSREVLLTGAHIGNLAPLTRRIHDAGKLAMVHSDFIGGFRPDAVGVRLLKNQFGVDAMFSSSAAVLREAHKWGLGSYLRIFLVDSRSLDKAVESIRGFEGDGVELLPGPVAGRILDQFRSQLPARQILAGGFISTVEEVSALRALGFDGVTTSSNSTWSDLDEVHPGNR